MAALDVDMYLICVKPFEAGKFEVQLGCRMNAVEMEEFFKKIDGNDHVHVKIKELV
jgi:hypothetical protein